jgi:hypothetical protein
MLGLCVAVPRLVPAGALCHVKGTAKKTDDYMITQKREVAESSSPFANWKWHDREVIMPPILSIG